MKFDEAVQKFLIHQEAQGNRPRTIDTHRQRLTFFRREFGDINAVTIEGMDKWVVSMRRRGLAAATVNSRIKGVKQFYKWQVERGYIAHSPAAHLSTKRRGKVPLKAMAMSDLQTMIVTAMFLAKPRDVAILIFTASTGCRVGELASLTVSNLHLDTQTAHVYGKTEWRWVEFDEETARELRHWLAHRPVVDHDYVFTSEARPWRPLTTGAVYQAFRRLAKASGVKRFNPHSIRHLCGQTWCDKTNLELTRQKLGHADISTTAIYANQDRDRVKFNTDKIKMF